MSTFSQMFPPAPAFTEKHLLDLSSKVYIITGATSGVGLSLAKILYKLHATIYIGSRTLTNYNTAITAIQSSSPTSKGTLHPFIADLSDLSTLKPAITAFLTTSYRLDVLFLNAGIMTPPPSSKTPQGHDLELGVNCLAPFLLVTLLQPLMSDVSSHFCHPNPSIRVIWVSSLLNVSTPPGGLTFDPTTKAPRQLTGMENYMQSKAGVYLLAHEFSLRQKKPVSVTAAGAPNERTHGNPNGVLHITLNPGFAKTQIQRYVPLPVRAAMTALFKGPEYGAYTELYAGLAPGVQDGDFVIPWGRKGDVPCHVKASTVKGEGGEESISARFYAWCEEQVRPFS